MIIYEWHQQLVAAVLLKTVGASPGIYGGAIRYRPAEYGDSLRRIGSQPAVSVDSVPGAESDLFPSELRPDDLGYFSQPVPEHLQAVSGKPEIFAAD